VKASELIGLSRVQQPILQKYSTARLHIDQNVMRLLQNTSGISIVGTQKWKESSVGRH
jgi:hypothetical protein